MQLVGRVCAKSLVRVLGVLETSWNFVVPMDGKDGWGLAIGADKDRHRER